MTELKKSKKFLTILDQVKSGSEVTGQVRWHDAPVTSSVPSRCRKHDSYESYLRNQIDSIKLNIELCRIRYQKYVTEIHREEEEIERFSFTRMSLRRLPIRIGVAPKVSIGLLRLKTEIEEEIKLLHVELNELKRKLFDYLVDKEESPVD